MPMVKNVGEPVRENHTQFDAEREETRPVGLTQAHGPGASRQPNNLQTGRRDDYPLFGLEFMRRRRGHRRTPRSRWSGIAADGQ